MDQKEFEKNFPTDYYSKSEYTLTKAEAALINSYQAIKKLGEMANSMVNQVLHAIAIPRVGHESKKGMGVYLDELEGKFFVYNPKHWCNGCKEAAGIYQNGEEWFCVRCMALKKIKDDAAKAEKEQ